MTPQRYERLSRVLDQRQPDLTIVLENVFDPHNVSAVMRTCDAVGIQEIYILNDRIPPHKKWGYRSSSTAAEWLTIHQFTDAEDCFKKVKEKYEKVFASHLTEKATDLYKVDFTQSIALVFGNETFGISDGIKNFIDGYFTIPQVGIIKSLNISVACAVTLYEAFRQKNTNEHYHKTKISPEIREALEEKWKMPKKKF